MEQLKNNTGQELQQGAKKTVKAGVNTARTVKTVQKSAAKATAGKYLGAAEELLKDENTRKIVAVVLMSAFFFTVVIFFVAPLTLYETITHVARTITERWEQLKEQFAVGYYEGTSGRFLSFFKALIGLASNPGITDAISDTSAGEEDQASTEDLQLLGNMDSLRKTYTRKIKACQDKINARQKEVLQEIKSGRAAYSGGPTIYSVMYARYESEEAHLYDDNEYVRVQYDGTEIMGTTRSISSRQAVELISLYSVQINSSINNIKLSGLLKWLGYNAGGKHRIVFSLGKNEDVTCGIDAWTGTFMPQYLIDEGSSVGKLDEYASTYGCSVADFVIFVECPDLYTIQATESEEFVTETQTYYEYVEYYYRDYDDAEKPVLDSNGDVLVMAGPYHWEYSDYYQRYLAVRNADAPPADYSIVAYSFLVEREREVEIKIIHVSYVVPVFVRTRSIDDLVDMTGMWSGWLPSEPPYRAKQMPSTSQEIGGVR